MQAEEKNDKIIFGSFPFRGIMQPVRLLCEYMGVHYENKFFNPVEWDQYKEKQAKDWLYQKIPFMKCGDLVMTNSLAAAEYLLEKYNRMDLFGTTEEQKIHINSSISFQSIIMGALSLECDMKKYKFSEEEKNHKRQVYWNERFYPKFKKAEEICKGPWFFAHISFIDFCIYEDYMLLSKIYPGMKNFKKIREVYENVGNLPAVRNYENSQDSIKECCPNRYFQNFAQEYKKTNAPETKSAGFSICENKSNNSKFGFCRYQKKEDKDDGMDLE